MVNTEMLNLYWNIGKAIIGIQLGDKRGSFATICLRNRCEIKDIAEVLGHKRIETTQKYYISSLEENKIF